MSSLQGCLNNLSNIFKKLKRKTIKEDKEFLMVQEVEFLNLLYDSSENEEWDPSITEYILVLYVL